MARVDREFLFECWTRYLTGELMKTRSENKQTAWSAENAIDQDAIVFSFASGNFLVERMANHRAKLDITKAIADYFRYSIE